MYPHQLTKLRYSYDYLEPVIDSITLEIHYSKHHATYVDNLNKFIEPYEHLHKLTLEELFTNLGSLPEKVRSGVINNAGGHYNHTLYWSIMGKDSPIDYEYEVVKSIIKKYGDFDRFIASVINEGVNRFGSGWVWLGVKSDTKELEIFSTANQDPPILFGFLPVIGIDVWEHAYYLKYQNRRKEYLENIFKILDWKEVNSLYKSATSV